MSEEKTMALEPAKPEQRTRPSALNVMAARCNVEPEKLLNTLKATAFKNATNEEMLALVVVANEYKLNPFLKEIYAFPNKGGGIVPVIGVDGWIKLVNLHPLFDGMEFSFDNDEKGAPYSCTCTLHIKGRSKALSITEFFSECSRNTDPWRTCPRRMLRHKTLIQAARVAFGFSGIYDEEEAERITGGRGFENAKPAKATSRTIIVEEPEPAALPATTETETIQQEAQ